MDSGNNIPFKKRESSTENINTKQLEILVKQKLNKSRLLNQLLLVLIPLNSFKNF